MLDKNGILIAILMLMFFMLMGALGWTVMEQFRYFGGKLGENWGKCGRNVVEMWQIKKLLILDNKRTLMIDLGVERQKGSTAEYKQTLIYQSIENTTMKDRRPSNNKSPYHGFGNDK